MTAQTTFAIWSWVTIRPGATVTKPAMQLAQDTRRAVLVIFCNIDEGTVTLAIKQRGRFIAEVFRPEDLEAAP